MLNSEEIIQLLVGLLIALLIWYAKKLIDNLEHLDKTVTENNIYQKQHYQMLVEHKNKLENHDTRLTKLEFNGKIK